MIPSLKLTYCSPWKWMVGRQVFFWFQGGYCKKSQTNIVNITNQLAVGKMEGALCLTWQKAPGKKSRFFCMWSWIIMHINMDVFQARGPQIQNQKNIGSYTSWNWQEAPCIGSVSGTVSSTHPSVLFHNWMIPWLHFYLKTLEYHGISGSIVFHKPFEWYYKL